MVEDVGVEVREHKFLNGDEERLAVLAGMRLRIDEAVAGDETGERWQQPARVRMGGAPGPIGGCVMLM